VSRLERPQDYDATTFSDAVLDSLLPLKRRLGGNCGATRSGCSKYTLIERLLSTGVVPWWLKVGYRSASDDGFFTLSDWGGRLAGALRRRRGQRLLSELLFIQSEKSFALSFLDGLESGDALGADVALLDGKALGVTGAS